MKLAFVFPGQGSQLVGMGRALAARFAESRAVFEAADAALGMPLSELCFSGPEAELQLTANTQPALVAASMSACAALEGRGVRPDFVAGHSLGEYSALVAARSLSLEDAVVAVRRRGQYMQEAVPLGAGAMAAILMLEQADVVAACEEAAQGQVVAPANFNSPGQIVIAGHTEAVDRAMEGCRKRGARRAVKLPVSAPFHCALMKPAEQRLAADLARLSFAEPRPGLVNNADARLVTSAEECRAGLIRQVASPVRWQESVELLVREGVETFIEVGPGNVLAGLVKRIAKQARVLGVSDPESLQGALAALGRAVEA